MSKSEAKKSATQYLKDQAAIIKKYGDSPKLSGPKYRAALDSATKTFQSLSVGKKATT